ncbi:MAG: hypothetical protein EAZ12_01265 [Sphingobacteriia bacterium]|nr:MAG: hypothetical protein EAZ12_01265 [Sphingobacteriia bacterium]
MKFLHCTKKMMKKVVTSSLLLMCTLNILAQKSGPKNPEMNIKQYYFVMLTKGPNRNQDSTTAALIMKGHLANIDHLYNAGKLKVAGPFANDENWQGIFIFDCDSQKEVETLLKTDPAIKAGRLNYEIKAWYTEPSGSFKPGKPIKK